jgi:hypothetical protein
VAEDGDDAAGVGTRAAPFATLTRAMSAAAASDGVVFAAAGTYFVDGPIIFPAPLIGGLVRGQDGAWRSAGGTSTVRASGVDVNVMLRAERFVQDTDFVPIAPYFIGLLLTTDSRRVRLVPECAPACGPFGLTVYGGIHVALDTTAEGGAMLNDQGPVTLVDGALGEIGNQGAGSLLLVRCVAHQHIASEGPLVAVSTLFETAPMYYALSGSGPIELYGSTVRATGVQIEAVRFYGALIVVDSELSAFRALFSTETAGFRMFGTAIETVEGVTSADADACVVDACVQGAGNGAAASDGVGLPWFGLPAPVTGTAAIVVPTAVVGDLHGVCRGGPAPPVPGAVVP